MALKSVLLLLLLLLSGTVVPAYALDFNAFWLYRNSGGEGLDTRQEIQQRYTLGVGPQLNYRPTHALSIAAGVGYTRTQRDSGRGMITESQVTPSARMTLNNDLFLAQLAANISRYSRDNEPSSTSRSWDASLASNWVIPLFPSLRFNYSERSDGQDDGELLRFSDNVTSDRSVSVDWNLLVAQLDYRFSNSSFIDHESGSSSETETHFARLGTDGRLFKDRFSYNLSQQVQYTTFDFTVGFLDEDGFFPFELEGLPLGKVDTVSDLAPDDPDYVDPAQVISELAPLAVEVEEILHLFFDDSTGSQQQTDALRLYRLYFADLGEVAATSLQWRLYGRNFPDADWVLEAENISGEFDPLTDSVKIVVEPLARELLLVAVNETGIPLTLNRLRVFDLLVGSSSSTTLNYLTTAGARVSLTKNLSAAVNMTREQLESERDDVSNEQIRRSLSGQLRWRLRPWISPALGYSEHREESSNGPELFNRAYSLTVATTPLRTVNMSFGVTRNERFTNEQKINQSLKYNIVTSARIYPDLNSSLYLTWQDNEQLATSGAGSGVAFDQTQVFSSRFTLNARLKKKLIGDLTANYSNRERSGGSTENADTTFTLQYRPSKYLSLSGSYTAYLLDSNQTNSLGAQLRLLVLQTANTQLSLNYSLGWKEEVSQNISMNGRWNIGRNLSLLTQGRYSVSTTAVYSFTASLSFQL